jgi:hypothetical protein
MPHIKLSGELPGILSLFAFRPETAKPMRALAEVLLRGLGTLIGAASKFRFTSKISCSLSPQF